MSKSTSPPKLYRKARKLLQDPRAFLRDSSMLKHPSALTKWVRLPTAEHAASQRLVYMWGFGRWQHEHVTRCFPEYRMVFQPAKRSVGFWAKAAAPGDACIIWGYTEPTGLVECAKSLGIEVWRMGDGFLRSQRPDSAKTAALSLVLDKTGTLYFDTRAQSGLEDILQHYDFSADPALMESAELALKQLLATGVSKYNSDAHQPRAHEIFHKYAGPRDKRKRILLVGQVEGSASLRFGFAEGMSNLDLALAARKDHPDAALFFRPHPDVVAGYAAMRSTRSALEQMDEQANVLRERMSLANALECVDHVYTLTSLAGFEAVLRGLPVTVLGCPFYAGWGLTDDRKSHPRRTRKLSALELFAGAYALYPRYFEADTGAPSTLHKTIAALGRAKPASADDRAGLQLPRRRAVAFHVGKHWRPAVREILSEYTIRFVRLHKNEPLDPAEAAAITREAAHYPDLVFLVWGYFAPRGTLQLARKLGCDVHRFEDSFIRSVGLGAEVDAWGRTNWPLSLVLDTTGMYYNARRPSDIERLLSTFDFSAQPSLMSRARACIDRIVAERVTKYNTTYRVDARALYGEKTKRRVLVVGQVETDASIRYGCAFEVSNVDLVLTAVRENPDAEVIFKPHPAVMRGAKGIASDPRNVAGVCHVLHEDISLPDALETIDHVYVITSGSGFEALLRGIRVTCLGANFYTGWGLTDDRMSMPRRGRKLTLEQLFAGFYLLYSRYYDPDGHCRIELEEALDILARWREEQRGVEAAREGMQKLKQGDAEGAARHLQRATLVNHTQPRWYAALGEALALLGREHAALENYNHALNRFSEDGEWRLARANLRASLGERSPEIEADYLRAAELLKDPTAALVDHTRYLLAAGRDFSGAKQRLRTVCQGKAPSAEALGVLALSEWSSGELERGLQLFERAEMLAPWSAQQLFALRALSAREQDDWAASLYRRISRRLPLWLVAAAEGASRIGVVTIRSRSDECMLVVQDSAGDDVLVHCMRTPRESSASHVLLPEVSLRLPTSGWAYLGCHRLPPSITLISVEFGARLEHDLGFVPSMDLLSVLWLWEQLGSSARFDVTNLDIAQPETEQDTPRRKREKQHYRRHCAVEAPIAAAPLGRVR